MFPVKPSTSDLHNGAACQRSLPGSIPDSLPVTPGWHLNPSAPQSRTLDHHISCLFRRRPERPSPRPSPCRPANRPPGPPESFSRARPSRRRGGQRVAAVEAGGARLRWRAGIPGGLPAGGGARRRAGPGKGRARRASGGDGSAEGRCEAPARPREPWREAAPRRPLQSPRLQQLPRSPPRGPPGRRPRAPRVRDVRALANRASPSERGRAQQGGAGKPARILSVPESLEHSDDPHFTSRHLGPPPSHPTSPGAPGRRAGGQQKEESQAEPRRACPVPPGRLRRKEPERPGGQGRAEYDQEEVAGRAERPGGPRTGSPRDRACCGAAIRAPPEG